MLSPEGKWSQVGMNQQKGILAAPSSSTALHTLQTGTVRSPKGTVLSHQAP